MKILYWLGLSILSGLSYRAGGIGGYPMAKLWRRLGCPACFLGLFWALNGLKWGFWWVYLLTFILNYAALSTYCSTIIAPEDDVCGIEWFMVGWLYGFCSLPMIIIGIHWYMILARALFLAITICWLRVRSGNVWKEELGSGILYVLSTPLLLI